MTIVINLYGGPGCGKSTLAAELFYRLKNLGKSVELVREYVKDWAWENRKITAYDQPYIVGNQIQRESRLYRQVDYIVTDSPIMLAPFYQKHYSGTEYVSKMCRGHIDLARNNGVGFYNFLLKRNKPYDNKGRYETEEQAKVIDAELEYFLKQCGQQVFYMNMPDDKKASAILGYLEIK